MDERCLKGHTRNPANCQILFHGRTAGIIMAVPFVLCFTLFGIFNLVGGTVLTIMACKPKISKKGLEILQRLMRNSEFNFEQKLDPMQVIGIILLLTGCLLVIIGISLGVVACRSGNEDKRRRKCLEDISMSGIPLSTMAERSSRRASSTFSSHASTRKSGRKKSFTSENVASPILEEDSELEEPGCDNGKTFGAADEPSPGCRSISFRQHSSFRSKDVSFKVTWASEVVDTDSKTIAVAAEIEHTSQSCSNETAKTLLTTDL